MRVHMAHTDTDLFRPIPEHVPRSVRLEAIADLRLVWATGVQEEVELEAERILRSPDHCDMRE